MVQRIAPGPGQESVWDYPRPPRLEPVRKRLRVVFAGVTIADTARGFRALETSHPPTYYLPQADVRMDLLEPSLGRSFCEWKGAARYWSIRVEDRLSADAAWSYPTPTPGFAAIADHLAFYAGRVDGCWVNDEAARAQAGGFYGGWITNNVAGPFKGETGSGGW